MFTGIIEEMGEVLALQPSADVVRLTLRAPLAVQGAKHGDSISVSGVCLTVVAQTADSFTADVMRQTLDMSTIGALRPGDIVNLERAALVGDRLGGHIVQGHIDGTSSVLAVTPGEAWSVLRFSLSDELAALVVDKGSIAVAGVSLTVSNVGRRVGHWFEVSLIPETLAATTLGSLGVGDTVNVETDILARHVERLLSLRGEVGPGSDHRASPEAAGEPAPDARPTATLPPTSRVTFEVETPVPTTHGMFRFRAYHDTSTGADHLAIVAGDPAAEGAIVRVHSECLTGEAFGSLKCECGPQLDAALDLIAEKGGVVIYLRGHEGRGIGLLNKLRAYRLQEDGLDTVDANTALHLPVDAREYGAAAAILNELGLSGIRLLTNNPDKVLQLQAHGITIASREALVVARTTLNAGYLDAKRDRLGHLLPSIR